MSLNKTALLASVAALGLSITGCAAQPAPSADPNESSSTAAPKTPQPSQTPEHSEPSTLKVSSTGHGPVALTSSSSVKKGTPQNVRLITGPGHCFALKNHGRPRLVVFPEDTSFVLRGARPAATLDQGRTIQVGQSAELTVTEMSTDQVSGIPTRCARGNSETLLVVND